MIEDKTRITPSGVRGHLVTDEGVYEDYGSGRSLVRGTCERCGNPVYDDEPICYACDQKERRAIIEQQEHDAWYERYHWQADPSIHENPDQ